MDDDERLEARLECPLDPGFPILPILGILPERPVQGVPHLPNPEANDFTDATLVQPMHDNPNVSMGRSRSLEAEAERRHSHQADPGKCAHQDRAEAGEGCCFTSTSTTPR